MLPRVTTPKAQIRQRLIGLLDPIDEPISIASAIRDRDSRVLAIRLGDGSMSTWRLQAPTPKPST